MSDDRSQLWPCYKENSRYPFLSDFFPDCMSDTASTVSSIDENEVLLESLAQILVDTDVDWNDNNKIRRSLSATGCNEKEGINTALAGTVIGPPLTVACSRCDDYTIGLVCALPVEEAAVQALLDEEYRGLEEDNQYRCGRIGNHNVVLNCRLTSAAAMVSLFPSIRLLLLVGIGGGVPSKHADIRLGDVVVSQPDHVYTGLIHYDIPKPTPIVFQVPQPILLGAVANLRANHSGGTYNLSGHLSKFHDHPVFARKAAGPDILFEATYIHEGEQTCHRCNPDKQVHRLQRSSIDPVVHYGTIASGNRVIKDAARRDIVSSELGGVLCFETEAADLISQFPCLVIRGICDYADSHKNKMWQGYAASTAAAYAKELLSMIPPAEVARTSTMMEVIQASSDIFGRGISQDNKSVKQAEIETLSRLSDP